MADPTCPKCHGKAEVALARAPLAPESHVATYLACVRRGKGCGFWSVDRTPEHDAELQARAEASR